MTHTCGNLFLFFLTFFDSRRRLAYLLFALVTKAFLVPVFFGPFWLCVSFGAFGRF